MGRVDELLALIKLTSKLNPEKALLSHWSGVLLHSAYIYETDFDLLRDSVIGYQTMEESEKSIFMLIFTTIS